MKTILLVATAATLLAACDGMGHQGQSHNHEFDESLSIEERIAASTCNTSSTERRDQWLATSKPSWAEYVEGHKANTDDPVENSSIAMAYKSYLNSGQDHEKANGLFESRHIKWDGRYPNFAKCWVQYEGKRKIGGERS